MIPFLSTPVMYGLAAVAVVGLVGAGVQTLRVNSAKSALTAERLARSQEHEAASAALLAAIATNLKIERGLQARVDEQRTKVDDDKRTNQALADKIIPVQFVDPDGLRKQLAAARSAAATHALAAQAACDLRSSQYEGLLADGSGLLAAGVKLAGEAAKAADDRSAEVKALIEAWPQSPARPQ